MLRLTDFSGARHYVAAPRIVRVEEVRDRADANARVFLADGVLLFVVEHADQVAEEIEKGLEK